MASDPEETRARLDRLLREAEAAVPERPVEREAPVLRARRAIRIRYAVLAVSFVALTLVLTAGAVFARDRLDGTDGATGPTTPSISTTPTVSPPRVEIRNGPDDPTNETLATFAFNLEGAGTAQCSVNGRVFSACETGVQVSAVEGENTFQVRGVSPDGTFGDPVPYSWTVDLTGPTINSFESIVLAFAPGEATPECSVDDVEVPCSVPVEESAEQHKFEVVLPGVQTLTWILDPTPQQVSFSAAAPEGVPPTSTIQLAFTLNEEGIVTCSIEGRQIGCVGGSLMDQLMHDAGDPVAHTIELEPRDLLGNPGTPRTFTWSFDHDEVVLL